MPPTKTNFRAAIFPTEDVFDRRSGDDSPFFSGPITEAPFLSNELAARATAVKLAMLGDAGALDEVSMWDNPLGTSRITGGVIMVDSSVEARVRRTSQDEEFDLDLIRDDDLLP
jgi:hypothetical protein